MILHQYKIVFGGSIGAGKSTAIQTISEIDVITTEAKNADTTTHQKSHTTVGIDYGETTLDDGVKLGLYGTPGQQRFDFMWPMVGEGAIGAVILIDHSATHPIQDLQYYYDAFKAFSTHIVIGITHVDVVKDRDNRIYQQWMAKQDKLHPLFFIDAREKKDVLLMLETLIAKIEVKLENVG